ncbi:alkaline phosphatase [Zymomonas mobilis]|uniref:alkaline phosphatase family protein n=1 Tax=Zymomonas mobilis TaxID=542 RepID=UPI000B36AD80|nr:alkaline phosphatase family protein [Zymomonas mobilis]ART92867.1 alkaline phosphatase [Zymomonas mobilis subsp. mobilis]TWD59527.1 alkaline phosphatase [Zymomonas mobilis]
MNSLLHHSFLKTVFSSLAIAIVTSSLSSVTIAATHPLDNHPKGEIAASSETAHNPWSGTRLIVAISVDQFSSDLFSEYRGRFRSGMKQLQNGVVYPMAYHSHAATETCPGHSVLLTGDHPARTGIIANNWYDFSVKRADKKVYCSEDPSLSADPQNYQPSVHYLKVPTLGDRMKKANPHSRVISVAGKDRAAIMMGGHMTDQIWFWSDNAYKTLADHKGEMPATVKTVNEQVTRLMQQDEAPVMPSVCADHASALKIGNNRIIGLAPASRKAGDFKTFRVTPDYDRTTTDIAIGLIDELKLGHGNAPDLLTVSLSATDAVGHAYGTEGAEMCSQMAGLDDNIARIIAALDSNGVPYVLVLTADHGGQDVPERAKLRGVETAQRVDPALSPDQLSLRLAERFRLSHNQPLFFANEPQGDWYINRNLPEQTKAQLIQAAKSELSNHPQVAAVFTASELTHIPYPTRSPELWNLAERAKASFDPLRSGDLIVLLKPRVTPIAKPISYVATHGSAWDYDRRVPIIFYTPHASGFEQPMPVETVDIMPSLAALLQIPLQKGEVDGRCLDLDPTEATTCPVK